MVDLEQIGIEFNTSGLEKGTRALGETEKAANKTADASDAVSKGFAKTSDAASILATTVKSLATGYAALKLYEYVKDATMLAARYETLGVAMTVVGKNVGYTANQMDIAAKALQQTGISMMESRQQAMSLVQAHIDLSNATKLARIAQDAAVIGNMNSSEAFARMIHGISTGQTEVLRTIGLNISMEQSYKTMAASLGKHVDALSQNEKTQAILNAVYERGSDIAGTYEAAMGTAGKQILSMTRYSEDLKVKQGELFNEALTIGVMAYTAHLKDANGELDRMATNGELERWAKETTEIFVDLANAVNNAALAFQLFIKSAAGSAASVRFLFNSEARAAILAAYDEDEGKILSKVDRFSKALDDRREALEKQKAVAVEAERKHQEDMTNIMLYYTDLRIKGMMSEKQYLEIVTAINDRANTPDYKDNIVVPKAAAISEYERLTKAIKDKIAEQEIEIALGEHATQGQKEYAKFLSDIAGHYLKLKPAEVTRIKSLYDTLIAQEKLNKATQDAIKQEYDAYNRQADLIDADQKHAQSVRDGTTAIRDQTAEMGLTKEALLALKLARVDEQIENETARLSILGGADAYGTQADAIRETIKALQDRKVAMGDQTSREIQVESEKAIAAERKRGWEETDKLARDAFTSWATDGSSAAKKIGDTLKKSLLSAIYEATLKPIVLQMYASITGSSVTSLTGATGGSGSLLNTGSNLYSAYNSASSLYGIGSQYLTGTMSGANAAGTLYANLTNTGLDGLLSTNSAFGTAATEAGTSAALSWAGWFAAAFMAVDWLESRGGGAKIDIGAFVRDGVASYQNANQTAWGLSGSFTDGDGNPIIPDSAAGTLASLNSRDRALYDKLIAPAIDSARAVVSSFGGTFTNAPISLQAQLDPAGTAPNSITSSVGGVYSVTRDGARDATATDLATESQRIFIGLIAAASGLPPAMSDVIEKLQLTTATTEQMSAALKEINNIGILREGFVRLGIGADHVTTSLIKAAGGAENLAGLTSKYYDNFYSDSEKQSAMASILTKQFSDIGFALPTTKEGFRAIADQLIAMGPAGETALAQLWGMQDNFLALQSSTEAVAKSAADAAAALRDQANAATSFAKSKAKYRGASSVDIAQLDYDNMYRQLVDLGMASIDSLDEVLNLTTEQFNALPPAAQDVVSSFLGAAQAVKDAKDTINAMVSSTNVGSLQEAGWAQAVALTDAMKSLSQGLDYQAALSAQTTFAAAEIARIQAMMSGATQIGYTDFFQKDGVSFSMTSAQASVQRLQEILSTTNGDLADFVIYSAQYSAAIAQQLVELDNWKAGQLSVVSGNSSLTSALEDSYARQKAAIIAGTATSTDALTAALRKISDYAAGMITSASSPLAGSALTRQLESAYQTTLSASSAGSLTALGNLQSSAEALLKDARTNASSALDYTRRFSIVRNDLQRVGAGVGAGETFAEKTAAFEQSLLTVQTNTFEAISSGSLFDIKPLLDKIDELKSELVDLKSELEDIKTSNTSMAVNAADDTRLLKRWENLGLPATRTAA